MAIAITLKHYLESQGIEYDLVPHPRTESSLETAELAHIPGDRLAKSVVLEDELGYVMAVLPATHRLELGSLHQQLRRQLGLATEPELAGLFGDCELGAIPAIGTAYGVDTVIDDSLAEQPDIYIEAGDHEALIHMSSEQFETLMTEAQHGRFSHHM